MSQAPLIWFQLLDSVTGEPYRGTTVGSIKRSSLFVPVIDQFREAVTNMFEKYHYLVGIPPSALLVFKNKTEFDSRNSNGGKHAPLEADLFMDGLGVTRQEALIVVVPSTIQSTPSLPP